MLPAWPGLTSAPQLSIRTSRLSGHSGLALLWRGHTDSGVRGLRSSLPLPPTWDCSLWSHVSFPLWGKNLQKLESFFLPWKDVVPWESAGPPTQHDMAEAVHCPGGLSGSHTVGVRPRAGFTLYSLPATLSHRRRTDRRM